MGWWFSASQHLNHYNQGEAMAFDLMCLVCDWNVPRITGGEERNRRFFFGRGRRWSLYLSTGWIFCWVKKKDKNAKVKHKLTYPKPNFLTFGQYIKWFPKKV